jgi:hypothetical protein
MQIGGHGFPRVTNLLAAHAHLTDLRFEHVIMDKIATGRR